MKKTTRTRTAITLSKQTIRVLTDLRAVTGGGGDARVLPPTHDNEDSCQISCGDTSCLNC
jgi:hypothetical protein